MFSAQSDRETLRVRDWFLYVKDFVCQLLDCDLQILVSAIELQLRIATVCRPIGSSERITNIARHHWQR